MVKNDGSKTKEVMKEICDRTMANMDDMGHSIAEDHQKKFLKSLSNAVRQIDYVLKYAVGLSEVDHTNLKITRTYLYFINNLFMTNYVQHDQLVSEMRPDLVSYVDRLGMYLDNACAWNDKRAVPVDLTNLNTIIVSSDNFIRVFYNPPRPSSFRQVLHRMMEKMWLMVRGVKG
jgi:hypothetical protein